MVYRSLARQSGRAGMVRLVVPQRVAANTGIKGVRNHLGSRHGVSFVTTRGGAKSVPGPYLRAPPKWPQRRDWRADFPDEADAQGRGAGHEWPRRGYQTSSAHTLHQERLVHPPEGVPEEAPAYSLEIAVTRAVPS